MAMSTLLLSLISCHLSICLYLFQVVNEWKGGAFHRNAGHVKQVTVAGKHPGFPLVFQEYHPDFPHVKVILVSSLLTLQSSPRCNKDVYLKIVVSCIKSLDFSLFQRRGEEREGGKEGKNCCVNDWHASAVFAWIRWSSFFLRFLREHNGQHR